ncbi:transcription factor Dp-1 isoform X3 [Pongo abelii]|uniref:transcription factor Dp-1 isoform X3 n=1 Tax=Pongo abelii TaxID=9601 RepID=UPI00300736BD
MPRLCQQCDTGLVLSSLAAVTVCCACRAVTPELYVITLRLVEKDQPLHPISDFLEGPSGSTTWPVNSLGSCWGGGSTARKEGLCQWVAVTGGSGFLDLGFLGVGYSGIAEFPSQPGLTTKLMGQSEKHPGHLCHSPHGCRGLPRAGAVGVLAGPVLVHMRSVFCEQRWNVYRNERRGGWARPVAECTVALGGAPLLGPDLPAFHGGRRQLLFLGVFHMPCRHGEEQPPLCLCPSGCPRQRKKGTVPPWAVRAQCQSLALYFLAGAHLLILVREAIDRDSGAKRLQSLNHGCHRLGLECRRHAGGLGTALAVQAGGWSSSTAGTCSVRPPAGLPPAPCTRGWSVLHSHTNAQAGPKPDQPWLRPLPPGLTHQALTSWL